MISVMNTCINAAVRTRVVVARRQRHGRTQHAIHPNWKCKCMSPTHEHRFVSTNVTDKGNTGDDVDVSPCSQIRHVAENQKIDDLRIQANTTAPHSNLQETQTLDVPVRTTYMTQLPSLEVMKEWAQQAEESLNTSLQLYVHVPPKEASPSPSPLQQSIHPGYIEKQYLAAISAWVQCAKKFTPDIRVSFENVERAEALLIQWHSNYTNNQNANFPPPSLIAHERVLHGWNRGVSRKDPYLKILTINPSLVADRAHLILEHYVQQSLMLTARGGKCESSEENKDEPFPLHVPAISIASAPLDSQFDLYHSVIQLCTKVTTKRQKHSFLPQAQHEKAERFQKYSLRASQLLDKMEVARQEQQIFELDSDTRKSYHIILRAFARTARTATETLQYRSDLTTNTNSGNDSTNRRIHPKNGKKGFTKKQDQKSTQFAEQAAREAERILDQLQDLYGWDAAGHHAYMEVLKAWCSVSSPYGAKRSRDILLRMERDKVYMPNADPYFLVLNAYAQVVHLVSFRATNRIAPAFDALEVLNGMEKRLTARSPEEHLKHKNQSADAVKNHNKHHRVNDGNDSESDDDEDDAKLALQQAKYLPTTGLPIPDPLCYGAVINAFAKSKIGEGSHTKFPAEFATEILNRMELLIEKKILIDPPNLYCYGNVLTAWANHEGNWEEAAKQAELMLERLEHHFYRANDLQAAVQSGAVRFWYNIVLKRIAESKLDDGPVRVENILTRMEELYHDSISTNSAIVVEPDARSYYAAIKAWARTGGTRDISRVLRARDILHRLISMHQHKVSWQQSPSKNCLPSVVCYNGVIIACAYTLGKENQQQAMQIAREVFIEICESPYAKPNADTFGRMIQCISRFEPSKERKDQEIEEMYRMCCEAGEVNPYVLNMMKQTTTKAVLDTLLSSGIAARVPSES